MSHERDAGMSKCWRGMAAALFAMVAGAMDAGAAGTVRVDPAVAGHPLRPAPMTGTVLPVWYPPEKVLAMAEGLRRGGFALYRYPNGTLSNEYHWNGKGTYDTEGIWHPSRDTFASGFKANTLHRGTTRNNYGSVFASHLFDGDTSTWWRAVTEEDSIFPWFVADLGKVIEVDSLEVVWRNARPDSLFLASLSEVSGDPFWSNPVVWNDPAAVAVDGAVTRARLDGTRSGRWFSMRFKGGSGDLVVREVRLFRSGKLVSGNRTAPPTVSAYGTHPGSVPTSESRPRWDFDTFMATLAQEFPGAEPLVCVNVGTGTPEEAAAWVHYANAVRRYGVKRWHVGNEMDGNWEQGGPLDAGQYAARFAAFSRAMKAEDSTIEVYGPVISGMDWMIRSSGRDDLGWMPSFLRRIGDLERREGRRLLDGVDFHAYPYNLTSGIGNPAALLRDADRLGGALDLLRGYMARYLDAPDTRKVAMSEFNGTGTRTYLLLHQADGVALADMFGHLASRFGDRAVTSLWEPENDDLTNADGVVGASFGTLRLFTPGTRGLVSDLPGSVPTGAFWGQFLATSAWIERGRPGDGGSPVSLAATVAGNTSLRAFAARDAGRVSVMVLNLSSKTDSVALELGSASQGGEVLTWSGAHYAWDGTTSTARALPNLGPTASVWSGGKVLVPAYGALVFRSGASPVAPHAPEMLLRTQSAALLREGDTLTVTHYLRQKGGSIVSGAYWLDSACTAWPCPQAGATALAAFDGAWDGSLEGAVLRIPGLSIGSHVLRFEWRGADRSVSRDSVAVRVTGSVRAAHWIDRFDAGDLGSDLPGAPRWTRWVQADTASSRAILSEPAWPDTTANKRWFQMDFRLTQPAGLGYPNFASATLGIPRAFLDSTASRWIGIVFDYQAVYDSGAGTFQLQVPEDSVTDYDYHLKILPATAGKWVRDTLYWSDLRQGGWGRNVGPLEVGQIIELQFRAAGAGRGRLRLDNLALLGTEGEALPMGGRRSAHRAWSVRQVAGMLLVEAPSEARVARVRLLDPAGRERFRSTGTGLIGIPVSRAGIQLLELEADGKREVRNIGSVR